MGVAMLAMNTGGGMDMNDPIEQMGGKKESRIAMRVLVFDVVALRTLSVRPFVGIVVAAIHGSCAMKKSRSQRCHMRTDITIHRHHAAEHRRLLRQQAWQLTFLPDTSLYGEHH
jgi:hypothetical protein